jgi:tetratricopeptide (TPR) repeat protein
MTQCANGLRTILLLLVTAAGCATLKNPMAGSLHEERKKREAETMHRMADNRDNAEFQSALARWNQQDVDGCRQQLDALLARNPKHRDAGLLMADVLVSTGKSQEALARVAKLADAYPDDADVHYAMGLLLDASGRRAEALPHYDRATKIAPNSEVYAVSYRTAMESSRAQPPKGPATTVQGPATSESGRPGTPKPAEKPTELAVIPPDAKPLAPRSPGAAGGLSASAASAASAIKPLAATGKADKSAPAGSNEAAIREPAAKELQMGCAALERLDPRAALTHFREAAATEPDNPQILISAGTAALRANQPKVAVDLLGPAKNRFKDSAALYRILGTASYRLGDYQSSQLALRQALSLDNSNALSYFLMGSALLRLGQTEAADPYFRQAAAIDPRYGVRR